MRVKIAALADYASLSGKKLNILGIFSVIYANQVPCRHTQMAIVVQFEFDPIESGQKQMRIELRDEDGQEVFSVAGMGMIPAAKEAEPTIVNQIVSLRDTVFPAFGQYDFKVLIDDEPVTTLPVKILPIAKHGPAGV